MVSVTTLIIFAACATLVTAQSFARRRRHGDSEEFRLNRRGGSYGRDQYYDNGYDHQYRGGASGGYRRNSGGSRRNSGGYRRNSGGYRRNSGGYRRNYGGYRRNSGGYRRNSGGY